MTGLGQSVATDREAGPLYAPPADARPHATWDRYGHVRIHVGEFSRYLTPLEAASLAEALEDCANKASDYRPTWEPRS